MSSNLGLLLSMFILIPMLLFSGDLACLSALHSELDAVALSAGYQISMAGSLTKEISDFVYEECGGSIYYVGDYANPRFGDAIVFEVSREYKPFVIDDDYMTVAVRRTAVIGYLVA